MDDKIWVALIAVASAGLTSLLALYGARVQARRMFVSQRYLADKDFVAKSELADKDFVAKSDLGDKDFIARSGLLALEDELRRERDELQRQLKADAVLARYRDPLIHGTFFLQQRLFQILRTDGHDFMPYLRGQYRRDLAIKSTLYRFAEYLAWREILRREVQFLNLTDPSETRRVQDLMGQVSRVLASDADEYGTDFMLWVEEQRAIADLMIVQHGQIATCMAFAGFVEQYDRRFARWFDEFATKLEDVELERSRLTEVFNLLLDLGGALDPDELRYTWRQWQEEDPTGRMVGKLT